LQGGTQRNGTQNHLLGEHGSRGSRRAFFWIRLPVGQSAGGSRIPARGVSTAITHYSGNCQTPWRNRAARTRFAHHQRMGLLRIHIRLDLGTCGALSCWRWPKSILPSGIVGHFRDFLPDAACEPPMPGENRSQLSQKTNRAQVALIREPAMKAGLFRRECNTNAGHGDAARATFRTTSG
jgi:hypothetical protein